MEIKWENTEKIEDMFYKLSSAITVGKAEVDVKVIRDMLKEQTLQVYIKGLIGQRQI